MQYCAKRECGFVLIMVLLFLQVFSVFGLVALENSLLEIKINSLCAEKAAFLPIIYCVN